jgi:hypothetical protein
MRFELTIVTAVATAVVTRPSRTATHSTGSQHTTNLPTTKHNNQRGLVLASTLSGVEYGSLAIEDLVYDTDVDEAIVGHPPIGPAEEQDQYHRDRENNQHEPAGDDFPGS